MLAYLDASALVKRYVAETGSRYVAETGSQAVATLFANDNMLATLVLSRVETVAALAKAIRVGTLVHEEATATAQVFHPFLKHNPKIGTRLSGPDDCKGAMHGPFACSSLISASTRCRLSSIRVAACSAWS